MEGLGLVLYWSALTVAAVAILVPSASAAFAAEAGLVLLAGPALLVATPALAPWLVLPVALFLVAPGLVGLLVNARMAADRFDAAYRLALLRAVLHPFDGAFAHARYCRAMASLQRDREAEALSILAEVAAGPTSIGLMAALQSTTTREEAGALLGDPRLDEPSGILRLRVEAAAGRIDAMIDTYRALLARRPAMPVAQECVRALIVLVHAGRPAGVAALDAGLQAGTGSASRVFHAARAMVAAGGAARKKGLAVLRLQAANDDGVIRRRAALCLAEPPETVDALTPERVAFLDRLETAVEALPAPRAPWRAPATLGLVALNLLAFTTEAASGSTTDSETLYDLGALPTIDFAWPTDAWRLGTEMFLHSGWIHIGANMLTLFVLGSLVERMVGPWRLLLLYLGSGIAANVGCVLLSSAGVLRAELIVGASGAIMGLVGGVAGSALRTWAGSRSPVHGRRLLLILAFVGLQFAIDATIPLVSSATHVLGAGAGLLLGLVLPFRWPAPVESFAENVEPARFAGGALMPAPIPPPKWRRYAVPLVVVSVAASLAIAFGSF